MSHISTLMTESRRRGANSAPAEDIRYEAAVVPGLEDFAADELRRLLRGVVVARTSREGRLSVSYDGDFQDFGTLRSVTAIYAVKHIQASRPSALLGHQNFSAITRLAQRVMTSYSPGTLRTLRVSAAGSESRTLRRFQSELASNLSLELTDAPANLEFALRRAEEDRGWELLLRLSPKPLSARSWRVCDYPGALNATVAHVMTRLTYAGPDEVFVNVCCGSGTLIAERAQLGALRAAFGFDTSEVAIACALQNLQFKRDTRLSLAIADAGQLPLPDRSVSTVVADLPFAMLVGKASSNRTLYPAIFREAARVLNAGGNFAIISTQKRLVQEVLAAESAVWSLSRTIDLKVPFQGGYLSPAIYALRRRNHSS